MKKGSRCICLTVLGTLVGLAVVGPPAYRWAGRSARGSGVPSVGSDLAPGSPDPLVQTIRAATTVLRGTVMAVTKGPEKTVRIRDREFLLQEDQAEFQVERVLKGPQEIGTRAFRFSAAPESGGVDVRGPETSQHGLVFLNDRGEVVDPLRPILLLGPGGAPAQSGQDPVQATKQEMIFSLREEVPDAILQDLAYELIVQLRVGFDEIRPAFTQLAASADDDVAATGLWGLAKYQDPAAVATLVKVAIAHASDPQHLSRRAIAAIGQPGFRDPALASAIEPLLDTNVYQWRRDTLMALRDMRSLGQVHRFAGALYEKNPELQYLGVTGLAWTLRAHGNEWTRGWGCTYEKFLANREHYLAFWKHWWETEGRAKYGKQ